MFETCLTANIVLCKRNLVVGSLVRCCAECSDRFLVCSQCGTFRQWRQLIFSFSCSFYFWLPRISNRENVSISACSFVFYWSFVSFAANNKALTPWAKASEWVRDRRLRLERFLCCADYEIRNFVLPEKQYLRSFFLFYFIYFLFIFIYYREVAVPPHLRPHPTRWGFSRVITGGSALMRMWRLSLELPFLIVIV